MASYLLHRIFQKVFHAQNFLQTDVFARRRFYTQTLLHTHKHFYTQRLLHTDAFTHRRFYTQRLLHTHTLFFYTHADFHTEAFTHRHFYTQTLLHADAFTHTLDKNGSLYDPSGTESCNMQLD